MVPHGYSVRSHDKRRASLLRDCSFMMFGCTKRCPGCVIKAMGMRMGMLTDNVLRYYQGASSSASSGHVLVENISASFRRRWGDHGTMVVRERACDCKTGLDI